MTGVQTCALPIFDFGYEIIIWEKKKEGKKRVTVEKTMSCFLFCRMGVDKHGPPSPRHTSVSEAAMGRAVESGQGPC